MSTQPSRRPSTPPSGEGPSHPTVRAFVVMGLVFVLIVVLAVISTLGGP